MGPVGQLPNDAAKVFASLYALLSGFVFISVMRRLGMGIVGPGFVGAHHVDAVRRLGFVDVVAVAASTEASARQKADALGIPKSYGSYEALAADPDVHVIHNTTPNNLHVPVIMLWAFTLY